MVEKQVLFFPLLKVKRLNTDIASQLSFTVFLGPF